MGPFASPRFAARPCPRARRSRRRTGSTRRRPATRSRWTGAGGPARSLDRLQPHRLADHRRGGGAEPVWVFGSGVAGVAGVPLPAGVAGVAGVAPGLFADWPGGVADGVCFAWPGGVVGAAFDGGAGRRRRRAVAVVAVAVAVAAVVAAAVVAAAVFFCCRRRSRCRQPLLPLPLWATAVAVRQAMHRTSATRLVPGRRRERWRMPRVIGRATRQGVESSAPEKRTTDRSPGCGTATAWSSSASSSAAPAAAAGPPSSPWPSNWVFGPFLQSAVVKSLRQAVSAFQRLR